MPPEKAPGEEPPGLFTRVAAFLWTFTLIAWFNVDSFIEAIELAGFFWLSIILLASGVWFIVSLVRWVVHYVKQSRS